MKFNAVLKSFRRLLKRDSSSSPPLSPKAETLPLSNISPPAPEKPYVTLARRRREMMLARPNLLYICDTANDIYHDRECKHAQAIPDEAFTMQEGFPKGKRFCTECYRKAMIRKGMGSQANRINSYLHAFNNYGAKKEDLYRLFIVHKAQVISISKGEQAVCFQVKDDRWRLQKQDGKLVLHHNNYKVLPNGERIFFDEYHRQNIGGSGSFADITRFICNHTAKTYRASGRKETVR